MKRCEVRVLEEIRRVSEQTVRLSEEMARLDERVGSFWKKPRESFLSITT